MPAFAGIKEAKKAYAQKQYQKAIKLFTEYSKESPSDGEPYLFMGYIYESQKDFPRSMAMFRRAVELNLNPKQRKTCYLKIILFYHYHQGWDIVAHYANKFLKLDPTNKEISKMRDRAYANKGHDPGNISAPRIDDIKPKQKKNSTEKETTEHKEKEVRPEPKPEVVKEKPKTKKNKEEERKWDLSLKYFKEEDYQKADKILQELIAKSPENKNYLYKAGIAKLRLGEYEKSIPLFERSKLLADEEDTMLLYYLNLNQGQASQKLGKISTAISLYETANKYNQSLIIQSVLVKLYYETSKYENAIKTSELILKSDSDNLEANMYKSLSLIATGKKPRGYKNLLEFTKKINRLYPDLNTVPEKYHEGLLQTGVFYSNRTKYQLALKYLTIVSSTKSKSPKFNFALGKSYFYSRRFELALVFLGKIPEIAAANYLSAKYHATTNNIKTTKDFLLKAANQKDIYWIKAKTDPYFMEVRRNPEFASFIETKGINPPPVKKEIPVVSEIKKEPKKETEEVTPVNTNQSTNMPESPKEAKEADPKTEAPQTPINQTPITNKTEN